MATDVGFSSQWLFANGCHVSMFVVYTALGIFITLFSLKLDEVLHVNYWLVFLPLWIWKGLVIISAVTGTVVWLRLPADERNDAESRAHFLSMCISSLMQMFLLLFEVLVCEKLLELDSYDAPSHFSWTFAFMPLIMVSVFSAITCLWAVKKDRRFDLEMFCSINTLQWILMAMKLDKMVDWSWLIVLAPLFVLTSVALLGMIYALIFACLVAGHGVFTEHRWTAMRSAVCSAAVVVPGVLSEVLFVIKLTPGDYNLISFFTCCLPLVFICVCLSANSCGVRGANPWQFGLRKDLFTFCIEHFPLLGVYGNVAFHKRSSQDRAEARTIREMREAINADFVRRATIPYTAAVVHSMPSGSTRSPLILPTSSATVPASGSSAASGEHTALLTLQQPGQSSAAPVETTATVMPLTVIVHRDAEGSAVRWISTGDVEAQTTSVFERMQSCSSSSKDGFAVCKSLDQPD